jgi:taurine dioxygenase
MSVAENIKPGTIVAGLPMPEFRRIKVEPLTGACGAEVTGVDLSHPLDVGTLEEVKRAFAHFLVLVFRDQNITIDQHKAFSNYFGELTEVPQAPTYAGNMDIQEVRREAHEPVTVVPFTRFHTDSPFLPKPPYAMVMRALDVPVYGGDTAFANMFLAYDALSDGLKKLLGTLKIVYSARDIWERNRALPKEKQLRMREEHGFGDDELESVQPAVRTDPLTGRKALYVTNAYFKHFEGWSAEDSKPLLDYLAQFPYRIQYQCRVHWKPGTVMMWDNRYLQHCGVHDYENERRHLIRTTIAGQRVV